MARSGGIAAHLRSNVVGYMALFVALSGTAFAVDKIGSSDIAKNAVKAKHVKDAQISSADVADNGLTGADIAEDTLQLPTLAPNTLGGGDINESDLDPSVLQRRVSGTCGPNAAVAAIAADGTTTCDQDDSLAVMTGRVTGFHPVGAVAYAGASGYTTANAIPGPVLTLSPNTTTTASGLSVRLTQPLSTGFMDVALYVNGVGTLVDCDIIGPDNATCNSGDRTATIPPGATLALEIEHISETQPGDLLFGWTLR